VFLLSILDQPFFLSTIGICIAVKAFLFQKYGLHLEGLIVPLSSNLVEPLVPLVGAGTSITVYVASSLSALRIHCWNKHNHLPPFWSVGIDCRIWDHINFSFGQNSMLAFVPEI
jgi:hypothetical protein